MKKIAVSLLLAAGACVSGCIGPGLSGEMSREDAIRLYNGGISETAWLEELDTISRNLPMPDTKSVQLADGFLFYKTSLCNGEWWVTDIIPPADAPDSLKELAKSLRKGVPAPVVLVLDGTGLSRDGVPVSDDDLRALAAEIAKLPESQRPEIKISAKGNALAVDVSRILKIFAVAGVETVKFTDFFTESADF
ncbi:MAG: hypothetical protein IJY80_04300 [Opitutales bacterium]|nr:hypothetical protein [Opitutales bacterium]MBQ9758603.1 hypothetical protein [Opitutales bacterium]